LPRETVQLICLQGGERPRSLSDETAAVSVAARAARGEQFLNFRLVFRHGLPDFAAAIPYSVARVSRVRLAGFSGIFRTFRGFPKFGWIWHSRCSNAAQAVCV